MLPPSFPVGSLLFLHLGMTKPPGREVVLLVLLLVLLRENEPVSPKLHQREPVGSGMLGQRAGCTTVVMHMLLGHG